jgi:hypothetical protein
MMWKVAEPRYDANPALARALDVLFILHADHEQNCGTTAMRTVGSSTPTPTRPRPRPPPPSTAPATAAPTRPSSDAHEIGSIDNVDAFVETVKAGKGRLQGFGHRVYKNYDPRAKIIKQTADEVFEVTGKNPLLDIALKLEEVALSDEYFTAASSTPTSTSTRASSTRPWASPSRCSPCCSPSPAPRAGWRTGRSCSSRTSASPGPASSTQPVGAAQGEHYHVLELTSADAVRALEPDFAALARVDARAFIVTSSGDGMHDIVSRVFGPRVGINEDPVTGSAHCTLATYWTPRLNRSSLLAFQASARGGVLRVALDGDRVVLEGQAVTVLTAWLADATRLAASAATAAVNR